MNTHATSDKLWTEKELDGLMVEDQFRLRGLEVTRLDTFVDAAFAFVLTLLVISFDAIPSDIPEMLAAVRRIPGFAASFAILMMFWLQHRLWSRRYGLENSKTILYSLTLIFVMLVYVYPLRMVFEGLFSNLSGGYLSTSYRIETYNEMRMMFVFYSVGFESLGIRNGKPFTSNMSVAKLTTKYNIPSFSTERLKRLALFPNRFLLCVFNSTSVVASEMVASAGDTIANTMSLIAEPSSTHFA